MVSLVGIEATDDNDSIRRYLSYRKSKGESMKARNGLAFTLRAPIPKLDILVKFCSYPYL